MVSLEGNQLMINTTGAGNIPMVAHGENSFTMEGTGIEFVKDASGAVVALLQHWAEGDRYEPRRRSNHPPRAGQLRTSPGQPCTVFLVFRGKLIVEISFLASSQA